MTARLSDESTGNYTASKITYINSTTMYATFNLNGAETGVYDVAH